MEKLNGKSADIVKENIEKLKELFPDIFSENRIDFGTLKATLGEYIEPNEERYNFTWSGKSKARVIAQTPTTATLRPAKDESKNWDTTENLYIEGDNLEVLKLLQKSYHKQVKMIYIDPPYNTGKDFVYRDNFRDNLKNYLELTNQVDSEGKKLSTNAETNGRYHSDWLNMMYPRLKLARNLLKDDGVIFISIDDNEVANLRKICDEIFGEENFVGEFIWKSRQNKDNRSITGVSIDNEYILCFSKISGNRVLKGSERKISQYKNPDNDERGPWVSGNMVGLLPEEQRPNCHYDLINPSTGINYGKPKMGWRYDKKTMQRLIDENRILWPSNAKGRPRRKVFLSEISDKNPGFSSFIGDGVFTHHGTKEIEKLFSIRMFDFPKPSKLIKELLNQATKEKDLILDFFSGSATTAHAVMQLNAEDKGNRRYILVQLPEPTDPKSEAYKAGYKNICEIGKKRIRRAGEKIIENSELKIDNLDIGFKVFKLDSSNIKKWDSDYENLEKNLLDTVDNIKPDRTQEDLLYEILLKYGLYLTIPIEELTLTDKKVFVIDLGSLVICLDNDITLDTVEAIAKLKEKYQTEIMRVVFKDNGFDSSETKTNAIQILKQYGIDDVKSL